MDKRQPMWLTSRSYNLSAILLLSPKEVLVTFCQKHDLVMRWHKKRLWGVPRQLIKHWDT